MPLKMKQLLDMLGVAEDARGYTNAAIGSDGDYGKSVPDTDMGPLFPQLSSEF